MDYPEVNEEAVVSPEGPILTDISNRQTLLWRYFSLL